MGEKHEVFFTIKEVNLMNAVFNCDKRNDNQLNKILVLFYFYEQLNNKQNN